MSREPSSSSMQASLTLGGWRNAAPARSKPPEPAQPPRGPQKRRNFKIVVEPAKPKPGPATPTRGYYKTRSREEVVAKLTTTTEALTAEERAVVRGLRLSRGGPEAEATRQEIEEEVRRR